MFWKIVFLIVVLAVVGFVVGPCVYYGFIHNPNPSRPDMPCKEDATHSFYIENTGGLILTSDFKQHGQVVGSRIFVLHGFWEMRGDKFKFMEGDIILDEGIFGEITVKKRTKD